MSGKTAIKNCACKNEYQDKTYGPGRRVHNEGLTRLICSSCGTARSKESGATIKPKAKEKKK